MYVFVLFAFVRVVIVRCMYRMVQSMGLFAAIGALLGAGGGGVAPTPIMTTLWIVLTVAGAILMNIRACCCTKICNILMKLE